MNNKENDPNLENFNQDPQNSSDGLMTDHHKHEHIEQPKIRKSFMVIMRVIALILAFLIGYQYAATSITTPAYGFSKDEIVRLNKLKGIINEYYYKDVDNSKLNEMTMAGMVYGLKDPFSYYMNSEDKEEYKEDLVGEYVGVGVQISPADDMSILVIAAFAGSPAEKAGILPGDIIKKVNGTAYTYEQVTDAVAQMKGKEGEKVKLEIARNGEEVKEYEITKSKIQTETLKAVMLPNNILHLTITRFDLNTFKEMTDKLSALQLTPETRLILDLRSNPGGVVSTAVNIVDYFLDEGRILSVKYKKFDDETYDATKGSLNIKYPIVILGNGGTASASEIVIGALKDHNKAILMGTRTFGKGVVGQEIKIDSQNSVSLIVGEYFTPNGSNIHGVGFEPNIKVEMSETLKNKSIFSLKPEEDNQLQEAIKYIETNIQSEQ